MPLLEIKNVKRLLRLILIVQLRAKLNKYSIKEKI